MALIQQKGIEPKSITKPIQLLAAWLVGLVLVDSAFLITAKAFIAIEWLAATLIIASIINIPIFLISIFLLQTRFRPEMQEDHYYHEYLKDKAGQSVASKDSTKIISKLDILASEPDNAEGLWNKIRIMFNPHLNGSDRVREKLGEHDIPISEEFGGPNWIDEYVVSIGRYLSFEQVKSILTALEGTAANRISFANDDDTIYEWDKTVLIGAYCYNVSERTISIDEANNILDKSTDNVNNFYQIIFDKQRDEDA